MIVAKLSGSKSMAAFEKTAKQVPVAAHKYQQRVHPCNDTRILQLSLYSEL